MQKWEYIFVKTDFVAIDAETLGERGDEGWELVSVVVLEEQTYYYFKRPKTEETLSRGIESVPFQLR